MSVDVELEDPVIEKEAMSVNQLINERAEIKDQMDRLNKHVKELRAEQDYLDCLLYTSPSPRDGLLSRMPSSA